MARPAHHDQLVDVLRAVDELLDHVVRAIRRLDDPLAVIVVYHGSVVRARVCTDLPEPPAQALTPDYGT